MAKNNTATIDIAKLRVTDLVCFSHLRWDFVYQRPQHLMTRFAREFRVFFVEEHVYHSAEDSYSIKLSGENVWVITPCLQEDPAKETQVLPRIKSIINKLFIKKNIQKFIAWYYTPMALKISSHLKPEMIIYDCMDELLAFKFAPAELKILETELFKKADLVFTGGQSLYEAKKYAHHNIFSFPSSIDKGHFSQGRKKLKEPADQQSIPYPRFGFFGVIDERFNITLIKEVAERMPDWQIVLVGPVVKINPADLPVRNNIYYLGSKSYKELPYYLSGWDIATIPFEKNESTKFISPTKTPEYLAAGKPVISASIMDVVSPYGDKKLVSIADTCDEFVEAAKKELAKPLKDYKKWLSAVDIFLSNNSWENTADKMMAHIQASLAETNSKKISTQEGLKSVA